MSKLSVTLLLPSVLLLFACSTPTLPYEEISKHYVYQLASYESDPNFQTNIHTSIKLNIPFFKQFYDMGIKDKHDNISNEGYVKKIAYFSTPEFLNSINAKEQYISEKVHVETVSGANKSNIEKKIMSESIIAAYKAGYQTIQ
ncbi:Exc2 family lipoprotein [Providencia sp. Je.9.19]|uniref:Exc2 family lipoprotein n=1 Tax=unclassified Providencia TaxID=2633465 RepID=UPI003DAA4403